MDNFGKRSFKDLWLNFGNFLIEPLSEFLNEGKLIYFVPHDFIHQLPLHAFKIDKEPLIKKHSVVYLPSSSLLSFHDDTPPNLNKISVFGVQFEEEAKEIARIYNTEPALNVSKEDLSRSLNSDIIHISSHAGYNREDPLSSCIVLRNEELLTARELFDIKVNSNLITLSACETGMTKLIKGDELIGLTRSLLYKGVQSLIVSLWTVRSDSTTELMKEFYSNLRTGDNKAISLRKAQIKIMNINEYKHPVYWAPFILIGNWI